MAEHLLAVLRYPWLEGGSPAPHAVSERAFANHLAALWRLEWVPLGLDTMLRGLADQDEMPARGALVTFDCECRALIDVALPVLRTYRAPSVMFVDPYALDDAGGHHTWNDLRLLESQDVSIQTRGTGPAGPAAARTALEAELHKAAELYAYDEAQPDDATARAVRSAGYRAAFLSGGGLNRFPGADPLRLTRITMTIDSDLEWETIA